MEKKNEQNKKVLSEKETKKERKTTGSARWLIRLLDPLMVGGGRDGTGREGRKTTYDGRFLDPVMVGLGRAEEGRMTTHGAFFLDRVMVKGKVGS